MGLSTCKGGTDAELVVGIEGADSVMINHLPRVGDHIRRAGSDIAAGSEILSVGLRLRPQDTAQAASVGS